MKKQFVKRLIILCLLAMTWAAAGWAGDAKPLSQEELNMIREISQEIDSSPYLDGLHYQNEVSCQDCHGVPQPGWDDPAEAEQCLACHESREALAGRFDKEFARKWGNPHKSHLGDLDCAVCHKGHLASTVYCLGCHTNAPFSIPGQ
ncbi:cytochrome c3 family protein [Desulfatibacillum aliphaticivorans]|nr:cytochrome c3 family protein [Desulfatibacillum aliphaticivorans]